MARGNSIREGGRENEKKILQGLEAEKYPHYAALTALYTESAILLARRLVEPQKGSFSLIGGKTEFGLEGKPATEVSQRFLNEGLEVPTNTIARELAEEVFPSLAALSAEDLKRIFELQRTGIVYDARTNFFCFMYMAKMPLIIPELDPRELEDLKPVSQIDVSEINPLTRLFLLLHNGDPKYKEGIQYGKIEHIALPSDIFKAASGGKLDQLTKIEGPAYILDY